MTDTIVVKELTKQEMNEYKELKRIKLKHGFVYFLLFMIVPFLVTVTYREYLTIKALFFISFLCISLCSIFSYVVVYITSPHGFFFDGKYRLICKKCRGRIYESDSDVYKCYCGCSWSKEDVTDVIKKYEKG